MSVPSTHLVLFIASIAVAASVAGAFTAESSRLSGTVEEVGLDVSAEVATDIAIISDPGSRLYDADAGTISLHVQNLGETTLPHEPGQVDVFHDGVYVPASNLTVTVQGATDWRPDEVVTITIDAPDLEWGDHRFKVVVDGDQEVIEFQTCAAIDRTRLIFEDEDNNQELAMINRSGVVIPLGIRANSFSEVAADFDCDGLPEAAFTREDDPDKDKLFIIDRNGEVQQLGDVKAHDRRLAVGDTDGDGRPEVIFANRDDGDHLYRIEYGESAIEIGSGINARGVGGLADFNGDGDLDIVFIDGDGDLVYLDDQTVTDTGANVESDLTIGTPADFDGDGVVRVPVVLQGSKELALVDSGGTTTVLTPLVDDPKGSLATFDWDGDGDLEVVFQHNKDNKRLYYLELDGTFLPVLDDGGAFVRASDDGVA